VEINYEIHNIELLAIMMPLRNGIICLKEFNMKLLCVQTLRTYNISLQLVFWINAKFGGHCPCHNFNLSSHITLDTSKGNLMHCPIPCAFKKKCSLRSIMWCHYQTWRSSTLNVIGNSWWHNLFLLNLWRSKERPSCYWHLRPIK
jgi:hypothetical protein